MKPVTDPAILAALDRDTPRTMRPVSDPEMLKRLNSSHETPEYEGWGEYANDLGRTALQGVTLGFGDEITAGVRSILPESIGGASYDDALKQERGAVRRFREHNPATAFGTELATGFAVPGVAVGRAIMNAPTIARRAAAGARVGAGYGAVGGFGAGEGSVDNRLGSAATGAVAGAALGGTLVGGAEAVRAVRSASARQGAAGAHEHFAAGLGDTSLDDFSNMVATGARGNAQNVQRRTLDIVGEEMERHGGNHLAARNAALQRIQQEFGVSASTAQANIRNLTAVHRDSPLMMAEYPAVAESNRATRLSRPENVDSAQASQITNSGTHDMIDYLANQGGRADNITRNAVTDRQAGLADWFRGRLENLAPNGHTLDDAENMLAGVRRQARAEYDAVYNAPGGTAVNNGLLTGLMQRVANRHLNRMAGRSGEQADALRSAIDEMFIALPTGQRVIMPTLQMAQDMRGAVRGMITRAERSGNNHIVATLQPLYRDMTRVMERASPQWAVANRRWAGMTRMEDALEFGQRLTPRASVGQRQALAEFANLAPEAQDMVRVGWLQQQFDQLANLRDTHDVSKLFDKRAMFDLVGRLFGQRDAVAFARTVRDAEVANKSKAMLGNSQTHRRGQMARTMDADLGIVSAAQNASSQGVRNWLTEKLLSLFRDRRNVPLAEISTTPMSDVFGVARNIHNIRQTQGRLERIRQPTHRPLAAAGAIAGQSAQKNAWIEERGDRR